MAQRAADFNFTGIPQSTVPVDDQGDQGDPEFDFSGIPRTGRASGAGLRGGGSPGGGRASAAGPGPTAGQQSTDIGVDVIGGLRRTLLDPHDPRTPEGRANLAGMAGAAALSYATGGVAAGVAPTVAQTIARVVGPIVGAGVAGGLVETGEQMAGTRPRSNAAIVSAVFEQGSAEAIGQGVAGVGRRLVRTRGYGIAREADRVLTDDIRLTREANRDMLSTARARANQRAEAARLLRDAEADAAKATAIATRQAAATTARSRVEATRAAAAEAVERTRTSGAETVQRARNARTTQINTAQDAAREATRLARATATEQVAQVELDAAQRIRALETDYDAILGRPPAAGQAASLVTDVLAPDGPAKMALKMAGERVSAAAVSGPPVPMAPIKQALDDLIRSARPEFMAQAAEGAIDAADPGLAMLSNLAASGGDVGAKNSALLQSLTQQLGVEPTHPLSGLLGQIQSLTDPTIPFADAHRLKMLLDESVNWDRTAKKHLERVTKNLRTTLRDQMKGHAPYDQATAAYQSIVPLYEIGMGRSLRAAIASGQVDRIAKVLNPDNTLAAQQLRSLIVDQSVAGGGREVGERAWDSLVDSFTYDRLTSKGIDKVGGEISTLFTQAPEFAALLYSTPTWRAKISRLGQISDAYDAANRQMTESIAGAKASGQRFVTDVADKGRLNVRDARAQGNVNVNRAQSRAVADVADVRALGSIRTSRATADATADLNQVRSDTATTARAATRRAEATLRSERFAASQDLQGARHVAGDATRAARDRHTTFRQSSLGDLLRKDVATKTAGEAVVAVGQQGRTIGSAVAIMRLLRGPRAADILHWATETGQNTQRLRLALESRLPDRALAMLVRDVYAAFASTDREAR